MARKSRQQNAGGSGRLQVAAVQMKFAPAIDENLAKIEQLLGQAARRRADAVLLPECTTTGYAYDFSRLLRDGTYVVFTMDRSGHYNVYKTSITEFDRLPLADL